MKAYVYAVNQETGEHTFEGEGDTWDVFEGDERARTAADFELSVRGSSWVGGGAAQLFHLTSAPLDLSSMEVHHV